MKYFWMITICLVMIYAVGIVESAINKFIEKMEVVDEAVLYIRNSKPQIDEAVKTVKKFDTWYEEGRSKILKVDTRMEQIVEQNNRILELLEERDD